MNFNSILETAIAVAVGLIVYGLLKKYAPSIVA